MKLAKEQIVKIIRDAGKIPVERDVYYHPLKLYADNVIGKIPYLNSVPFYADFEKRQFKILPGRTAPDGRIVVRAPDRRRNILADELFFPGRKS